MTFTRSKFFCACALASSIFIAACSNSDNNDQKDGTLTATTPATGEASTLSERNAQQRLIKTLNQHFKTAGITAKVENIQATEVPNLFWVNIEGMPAIYATADGKYIIQGDVIRLGDKQLHSVGEPLQAAQNKTLLAQLKKEDLIIYKAQGKTKHVIYVFTDASCPYCHKLHEQMKEINAQGIEVRYIAWPRGEQFIPTMESIWCSPDRAAAFNKVVQDEPLETITCKNPVTEQYQLGLKMGVNGTPAIYTEDGNYLGGYLTPEELAKRLNN